MRCYINSGPVPSKCRKSQIRLCTVVTLQNTHTLHHRIAIILLLLFLNHRSLILTAICGEIDGIIDSQRNMFTRT